MTTFLNVGRLSQNGAAAVVELFEALEDHLDSPEIPQPRMGTRRMDPKRSPAARKQAIQRKALRASKGVA